MAKKNRRFHNRITRKPTPPAQVPPVKAPATGTSVVTVAKTQPPIPEVKTYDSLPVVPDKFNPTIHPTIFAQMCAWFVNEQPNETAGYFNWDEEKNLIDWCWYDPNDNIQSGGHVSYGTAKMRMAWAQSGESGIPNGQWHTHPGLSVFWSSEDKKGQIDFVNELTRFNPDGYFCFIVFDELNWLTTKIVWQDGKPTHRETGKVLVNDVALEKKSQTVKTYGVGHWGTYYDWNGDTRVPASSQTPVLKGGLPLKGKNPKLNSYYGDLFDTFLVEKFDWEELYLIIEEFYPGQYEDIINEVISWNWIRADFDRNHIGNMFGSRIFGL